MGDQEEPMDLDKRVEALQLENTVPPNTPSDRQHWTVQQEQEHLRREKEDETLNALGLRIEKQKVKLAAETKKLKRLEADRSDEIQRVNRRRSAFDKREETKTRFKCIGDRIQERKAIEDLRKKFSGEKIDELLESAKKSKP